MLAHGGYKSPEGIKEDSQEDRDLMWRLMVTREGALPVTMKVFPSVQEMTRVENRLDFAPRVVNKQLTIEFDRKRRPVREGMTPISLRLTGVCTRSRMCTRSMGERAASYPWSLRR